MASSPFQFNIRTRRALCCTPGCATPTGLVRHRLLTAHCWPQPPSLMMVTPSGRFHPNTKLWYALLACPACSVISPPVTCAGLANLTMTDDPDVCSRLAIVSQ